jgi:hypothetical protein
MLCNHLIAIDTNGQIVVTVDHPVLAIDIDNAVYAVNLVADIEVIKSEDVRSTDPAKKMSLLN